MEHVKKKSDCETGTYLNLTVVGGVESYSCEGIDFFNFIKTIF